MDKDSKKNQSELMLPKDLKGIWKILITWALGGGKQKLKREWMSIN